MNCGNENPQKKMELQIRKRNFFYLPSSPNTEPPSHQDTTNYHQQKPLIVPRDGATPSLKDNGICLCAKEEERVECGCYVHFRVFKKY